MFKFHVMISDDLLELKSLKGNWNEKTKKGAHVKIVIKK